MNFKSGSENSSWWRIVVWMWLRDICGLYNSKTLLCRPAVLRCVVWLNQYELVPRSHKVVFSLKLFCVCGSCVVTFLMNYYRIKSQINLQIILSIKCGPWIDQGLRIIPKLLLDLIREWKHFLSGSFILIAIMYTGRTFVITRCLATSSSSPIMLCIVFDEFHC